MNLKHPRTFGGKIYPMAYVFSNLTVIPNLLKCDITCSELWQNSLNFKHKYYYEQEMLG